MSDKELIIEEIKKGTSFLIMGHINPDGDSLGSVLGLFQTLKKMGKRTAVVSVDPVPEVFDYLPGRDQIMAVEEVNSHFSTAIVLDCSDLERLGKARNLLDSCQTILNIDHHITNQKFGHYNYVVKEAAATGQIVYDLLSHLPIEIDEDIAIPLYTALMTDTGGFRHSNTSSLCFQIAAELTNKGANPHLVAEKIYQSNSFNSLQLLGKILASIKRTPCGRVAWVAVSQNLLKESGCSMESTEGFISYLIGIQGVEVAILFKELEENMKVKVSFRARDKADVSKIAAVFGGGGHVKAAGCLLENSLDSAQQLVLNEVSNALL